MSAQTNMNTHMRAHRHFKQTFHTDISHSAHTDISHRISPPELSEKNFAGEEGRKEEEGGRDETRDEEGLRWERTRQGGKANLP